MFFYDVRKGKCVLVTSESKSKWLNHTFHPPILAWYNMYGKTECNCTRAAREMMPASMF